MLCICKFESSAKIGAPRVVEEESFQVALTCKNTKNNITGFCEWGRSVFTRVSSSCFGCQAQSRAN